MPEDAESAPPSRGYSRGSEEFGRVLTFSDGLFAIAMTLLVVSIAVPVLQDGGDFDELAGALDDLIPNFVSFFISFAVIGRYWVAHHKFFSLLRAIDSPLVGINLVYLCFVAFLPFPTALLGEYFENPLSIAIYAVNVALISGLEVVEFRHAYGHDLLDRPMPEAVYRWGTVMSLSPVGFFLLSVPVAFVSTNLAVVIWFLGVPLAIAANRWKPEGADEFLV